MNQTWFYVLVLVIILSKLYLMRRLDDLQWAVVEFFKKMYLNSWLNIIITLSHIVFKVIFQTYLCVMFNIL